MHPQNKMQAYWTVYSNINIAVYCNITKLLSTVDSYIKLLLGNLAF